MARELGGRPGWEPANACGPASKLLRGWHTWPPLAIVLALARVVRRCCWCHHPPSRPSVCGDSVHCPSHDAPAASGSGQRRDPGEVAEWSKANDSKSFEGQPSVGSNPTLSVFEITPGSPKIPKLFQHRRSAFSGRPNRSGQSPKPPGINSWWRRLRACRKPRLGDGPGAMR